MPSPAHTRITWSGVFGGATAPVEIWAFGLNAEPLDVAAYGAGQVATKMVTAYSTHLKGLFGTSVLLTKTRVANVDASGHVTKVADGSFRQLDDVTQIAGTATETNASRKPISTALCVSLTTARAGATGKGRFYLPWPPVYVLETDYRVSAAFTDSLRDAAKSFLDAVNAGLTAAQPGGTATGRLVVASGGSVKTGEAPALSRVTGVKVGRVPDTMRSRRGAMLEGYSVGALA